MAKVMTLSEAETARRRAVTGLRNLGRDDDANFYEGLSATEYAEERGIELVENPNDERTTNCMPRSKTAAELREELADLKDRIAELEEENEDLSQRLDDVAVIASEEEEEEEEEEPEEAEYDNGGYNSD